MTILDAQIEENQVSNGINWQERSEETYPEEAPLMPLMKQLAALRNKPKREFTKQQKINFLKTLETNTKRHTCHYYDITRAELEEVINHGI